MTAAEQLIELGMTHPPYEHEDIVDAMIKFARHHVKKALETALDEIPYGGTDEVSYDDVEGILTCYPLDNIK